MGKEYNSRRTSWIFTFLVVVSFSSIVPMWQLKLYLTLTVFFGIYIVRLLKEETLVNIHLKQKLSTIM